MTRTRTENVDRVALAVMMCHSLDEDEILANLRTIGETESSK